MDTSEFFDALYKNARENSVLIMTTDGFILKVNEAFTTAFGYGNDDLVEKNFSLLFTEEDKKNGKPESELKTAKTKGCANDDNYLVHKNGARVWTSGESIFIHTTKEEEYIIKVIQNIHAQKQLEGFLTESNEFIESIFESVKDVALIILDSLMRIIKANNVFIKLFEIERPLKEQSRLTDLNNSFWNNEDIKKEIRNIIVTNKEIKEKEFQLETKSGKTKTISLRSKSIYGEPTMERKILIIIKEKTE